MKIRSVLMAVALMVPPLAPEAAATVHDVTIACSATTCAPHAPTPDIRIGDQVRWTKSASCNPCVALNLSIPASPGFPGFDAVVPFGTFTDPTPPFPAEGIYPYTVNTFESFAIVVRDQDRGNINLYLTEGSYSFCTGFDDAEIATCESLESPPQDGLAFVWVVMSYEDAALLEYGISQIEFGIAHNDVDILNWSICTGGSGFGTADWPASGSGYGAVWPPGCYIPPNEVARIGHFTIANGSVGAMQLTPHPEFGLSWRTCFPPFAGVSMRPENLGLASFAAGTEPCCGELCATPTPVAETTWTRLKESYR